ncbi:hypothetical protein F5051DRAFT_446893 [Lentinula edodes]|nr:hypothetical protein F5051DRAFT_446893 [Lentinula edodes]
MEPAKKIRKSDIIALNEDSENDDDEANSEGGANNSREGYMSCGCEWEPVLIEFYHWKTATIWSPSLEVMENWGAHELLSPRERCLVYGKWEERTGQRLDDMWKLKQEVGVNGRPRGLYTVQVLQSEQLEAQIKLLQMRWKVFKEEGN